MKPESGPDLDLLRVYHGRVIPAQVDRIASETRALQGRIPLERQLLVHLVDEEDGDHGLGRALRDVGLEVVEAGSGSIRGWVSELRALLDELRPRWIHSHGFQATLPAAVAGRLSDHRSFRHIHEVHGATAFESFYRNRDRLDRFVRFAGLYLLENLAAAGADSLLLVSEEFATYYPVVRLRPHIAVPRVVWADGDAGAGERHPAVREVDAFVSDVDGGERPTVVYSGSAAEWQLPGRTVRLMDAMVERLGFQALVLTTDPGVFRGLFADEAESPESAWRIAEVPRSCVLACLRRCDVGLLLREDRIFNRVACPTKLYQYRYAGLAVVTTPAVRAARSLLRTSGAGVEIPMGALDRPETCITEEFSERLEDSLSAARSAGPGAKRLTWQGAGREPLLRLYGLKGPAITPSGGQERPLRESPPGG